MRIQTLPLMISIIPVGSGFHKYLSQLVRVLMIQVRRPEFNPQNSRLKNQSHAELCGIITTALERQRQETGDG